MGRLRFIVQYNMLSILKQTTLPNALICSIATEDFRLTPVNSHHLYIYLAEVLGARRLYLIGSGKSPEESPTLLRLRVLTVHQAVFCSV
jgi:hypothetical protein